MRSRYIMRSPVIGARLLGGEMVIMSAKDSTLFSLNEVATYIWQAADGSTPLTEIVKDRICAQFEVDFDAAFQDAEALVDAFVQHGIFLVSDRPFTEGMTKDSRGGR